MIAGECISGDTEIQIIVAQGIDVAGDCTLVVSHGGSRLHRLIISIFCRITLPFDCSHADVNFVHQLGVADFVRFDGTKAILCRVGTPLDHTFILCDEACIRHYPRLRAVVKPVWACGEFIRRPWIESACKSSGIRAIWTFYPFHAILFRFAFTFLLFLALCPGLFHRFLFGRRTKNASDGFIRCFARDVSSAECLCFSGKAEKQGSGEPDSKSRFLFHHDRLLSNYNRIII